MSNVVRLLIADDQNLVRAGLTALLNLESDLTVVASCASGEEVLDLVRQHQVDVALLDIEMPGVSGLDAAWILTRHQPQCKILMVTTFGRPGYVVRALDAGAHGFVVKDIPAEELAEAVRRVHAGHRVIDPSLATETLTAGINPLTEREQDVLRLALTGTSVHDTATKLFLSAGTVRNYLSSAMAKTHTGNRTAAARWARDRGWL